MLWRGFAYLLAAATWSAAAMQGKVVDDQLILSGRIDGSELATMRDVLAEPGSARITTVVLRDSPGGDIWTALRVGETVRDKGWRTAVSGYCLSACTLIFLGGVSRHFTDDKLPGLTQIGFHAGYARTDSLRDAAGSLSPHGIHTMRVWIQERSAGRMSEALMDRFLGLENRRGFLHFFDPRRLRRADGAHTFFCTGSEDPKKKWEKCEKLAHTDAYLAGVVTSAELLRSNDRRAGASHDKND